ncbi:hypothetical protein MnTg01_01268 [archaeon MnTg01]|nr:hypothetical protein MnTg01_01268 [archaeon MnTg01]
MLINRKNLFSLTIMGMLFSFIAIPAFAEVETIQTDKLFYTTKEKIIFSGTVDYDSTGLVSIVIRDSNDKFVLLTQAIIKSDNTFERSVNSNEKFSVHGIYNATAFIVNTSEGAFTIFDYSLDGSPVSPSVSNLIDSSQGLTTSSSSQTIETEPEPISKIASFVDTSKDPQYYIDRYNSESAYKKWFDTNFSNITIEEAVGLSKTIDKIPQSPDIFQFIDPDQDPQYYIDRYNSESAYKKWFDTNFPKQTIYEAVGITPLELTQDNVDDLPIHEPPKSTQKISESQVQSSTISPSLDTVNADVAPMLLALGGLGILFGAVYGVKRRVDSNTEQITENKTKLEKKVNDNSEQIFQNRFWLKKKLMSLKFGGEPIIVIKERLAKGEITVDEYYKLLKALKK